MTDMETNVELEVLDDAQLDEVTGGLLDFSGIRTINLSTGSLGQVVVGNNSGGLNVAFTGVQVNVL
jgi:hypothetical protein